MLENNLKKCGAEGDLGGRSFACENLLLSKYSSPMEDGHLAKERVSGHFDEGTHCPALGRIKSLCKSFPIAQKYKHRTKAQQTIEQNPNNYVRTVL